MPLSCPMTDEAAAYLLKNLRPAEHERFRRHLRVCIACRRETDELGPVVDLLRGLRPDRPEHRPAD
ncbi:hypothetical protein ATK30_5571 [Amycolatopsis echigonensis]|uniref:Uncharacterized protein n=1 Tax=Amycolatopsis echigonensis TaxID=2576905 RepID=A0A2N3WLF8_9PSEU|nr:hypothetical protein ATK30_5571 [Amycolatopsis niigatensis]